MKIGRNDKCFCGSGKKFKKCCMNKQITNQNIAQPGTLRFSYNIKEGDDFYARFLMQMSQIRDCAYPREQRLAYDNSYSPVFQNLVEAKFAKEHCENLITQHKQNIAEGKDGIYHGSQIDVKKPIDDDLNMYFKDFFIRGTIAIDCLMRHTAFMGSGIGFLFVDDNPKKYKKGLEKFPLKNDDQRFTALVEMIKHNKTGWYSQFREIRRKIEHEGFALPHLRYRLGLENKVEIIFPTFSKQSIEEILKICWENLTSLCEEILVFLLSLKFKDYIVIVRIPENMRDKHFPARYAARHKDFPQANFSCG
jgi:hypothetical protein